MNHLNIAQNLLTDNDFLADWQIFLASVNNDISIKGELQHYVNGKNLACPMPLLKLKMALKQTSIGNAVYITATDPNSLQDMGAFCQHAGLDFLGVVSENAGIYHAIVQKMG